MKYKAIFCQKVIVIKLFYVAKICRFPVWLKNHWFYKPIPDIPHQNTHTTTEQVKQSMAIYMKAKNVLLIGSCI